SSAHCTPPASSKKRSSTSVSCVGITPRIFCDASRYSTIWRAADSGTPGISPASHAVASRASASRPPTSRRSRDTSCDNSGVRPGASPRQTGIEGGCPRAPAPPPPRRESLGEHLHHGVEVLARDVAVRVRPPHHLEQRILLPLVACHRRHDLLSQDVERVRRNDQPVELALVRGPHQRGTLDQLVARQREQPTLGHGGEV